MGGGRSEQLGSSRWRAVGWFGAGVRGGPRRLGANSPGCTAESARRYPGCCLSDSLKWLAEKCLALPIPVRSHTVPACPQLCERSRAGVRLLFSSMLRRTEGVGWSA